VVSDALGTPFAHPVRIARLHWIADRHRDSPIRELSEEAVCAGKFKRFLTAQIGRSWLLETARTVIVENRI
jgi:hypothetical protein